MGLTSAGEVDDVVVAPVRVADAEHGLLNQNLTGVVSGNVVPDNTTGYLLRDVEVVQMHSLYSVDRKAGGY